MKTYFKSDFKPARAGLALAFILGTFASSASLGQAPGSVVPVTSEPNHKVRFENDKVRMYEVSLAKGERTLMHEHLLDSFSVYFSNSEIEVEPQGRAPTTYSIPAGTVSFASTAMGPYSHRIAASKGTGFHVIAMELMSPKPDGEMSPNLRADPSFRVLFGNARGRAYRIRLAPGESTGSFSRPASAALFAISAGHISESVEGKPERRWDFETGQFRWMGTAEKLSLKNEGTKDVELVELDVF